MATRLDRDVPLVVDLDGTLVKSDLLLESLLSVARSSPWSLLAVPLWLAHGRARLKRELGARAHIAAAALPYRPEVLDLVREARSNGRDVILATASDESMARPVAEHLGGFAAVVASDGERNLKGPAKREALVARFGERGYDYAGDSAADLPVWASARGAIVVDGSASLLAAAGRAAGQAREIRGTAPRGLAIARALRIKQWPKNLLVFVPLFAAHLWGSREAFAASALAFAAFCLVASAIYVVNDLLDLQADRVHDVKRRRPFAAGDLGIGWGLALAPLLLAAGLGLALARSTPGFVAVLSTYAVLGLAYSLALKRRAVLDVIVVASLYTLRIVGGAMAAGIVLSDWLLGFSLFIFLSLALAKRHAELAKHDAATTTRIPGRGYHPGDAPLVAMMGTASGYLAVLVLALYITSDALGPLYTRRWMLWLLAVLVLYWITRVWLLAHRRVLDEDPLSFALHDPVSYLVGFAMAATVLAAT